MDQLNEIRTTLSMGGCIPKYTQREVIAPRLPKTFISPYAYPGGFSTGELNKIIRGVKQITPPPLAPPPVIQIHPNARRTAKPQAQYEKIIQIVCTCTGVTLDEIKQGCRKHHLATARHYICYFLRRYTQLTLTHTAYLINRHYSTVIHSVSYIKTLHDTGQLDESFFLAETEILKISALTLFLKCEICGGTGFCKHQRQGI